MARFYTKNNWSIDLYYDETDPEFWLIVDTNTEVPFEQKYVKSVLQKWLKDMDIYGVQLWLYTSNGYQIGGKYKLSVLDNMLHQFGALLGDQVESIKGEPEL